MEALGVTAHEIDIRPSCQQMLARHRPSRRRAASRSTTCTFENVQAGERTSHLFRLANHHNGLVVGTGDLSRARARLGDLRRRRPHVALQRQRLGAQDAHPAPDPLGRRQRRGRPGDAATCCTRSSTPRSRPSWCRRADGDDEAPAQRSEESIGPYELQDFHLYYLTRFGFRPVAVAFLAHHAWGDRDARRRCPTCSRPTKRNEYDLPTIKQWLAVFLTRFSRQPVQAVGDAQRPQGRLRRLALAARRLARSPSDSSAAAWLEELDRNVPRLTIVAACAAAAASIVTSPRSNRNAMAYANAPA